MEKEIAIFKTDKETINVEVLLKMKLSGLHRNRWRNCLRNQNRQLMNI